MKQSDHGGGPRLRPLLALALLAAVPLSFAGVTAARYTAQQRESQVVEAADFYFTSDLLGEGEAVPTYYIDPQTTGFTVTLSNATDDKRVTAVDITYSYTVQTDGAEPGSPTSGTLAGGSLHTDAISVTPAPGAQAVTVTATASSPYRKTLQAVFRLALGNRFAVDDTPTGRAAVLTMTLTDDSRAIALTLPDGVVPDATDGRVSLRDGGGYTFAPEGPGVYSLVLLKTVNQNLSQEETAFASAIDLSRS